MPIIHTMTKSNNKNSYTFALGRRKSAIATVKLMTGKSEGFVNDVAISTYFPAVDHKIKYDLPFATTNTAGKFTFTSKIVGGGKVGQLEALVLAISRALVKIDANHKPLLRTAGLLTVDSRVRERRMVGTGGKARRQKQSPKR